MRSIETSFAFPLAAVKPLEPLLAYRAYCIDVVRSGLKTGSEQRLKCPACQSPASQWDVVEGLQYARCNECATIFLANMPAPSEWSRMLSNVSHKRSSPGTLDSGVVQSRAETVYEPKLEWIHNTLLMQGISRPQIVEVTTPPSPFTPLLAASTFFSGVRTVAEEELMNQSTAAAQPAEAAVLLESLDRSSDPAGMLQSTGRLLNRSGLLFLTALVCSGFDMVVLGAQNLYLYPPDRANCFSLNGLEILLVRSGYRPIELSTPGVLDVEIIAAHLKQNPDLKLSSFERQLLTADQETRMALQTFLQQNRMSSFGRVVARKV